MNTDHRPSILTRIVRRLEGVSRQHGQRIERLEQMRRRHGR
ncbi:hypothetical protein [Fulvimarina endophytica]|nr:hypothetical protein [Fulvimarina endophytica]